MLKRLNLLPVAAIALAFASPLLAEDSPGADTVVATVNGTPITLGHMILIRAGLPDQYKTLPDDALFTGILDQIVQQTVLSQSLKGDTPHRVVLALENERRAMIAAEVVDALLSEPVSEAALEAAYNARFAAQEPGREFSAAHILVESEDEAKALVEELNGGADFAKLAQEKSTGPSGPNGGDLGWFGIGMMVKPFEDAVVAMQPGQISAPIQTQFGWHIIKLNETRLKTAPSLDEMRDELTSDIQREAIEKHIESLTAAAKIDRTAAETLDPALLKKTDLLEN